jgi:hypothetical protein
MEGMVITDQTELMASVAVAVAAVQHTQILLSTLVPAQLVAYLVVALEDRVVSADISVVIYM